MTEQVRLRHVPALDGLRGLAVVAVVLYHAALKWMPGGFLGVDVFFVISGYLITSLLLAEWSARGSVDLAAFWRRRLRRILPAVTTLIVATLAFALIFLPADVPRLRVDALAAFTYSSNWYLVFGHQPYFEVAGRPSLFQHLWSLAIEEQFYLLWPPMFVGLMLIARPRWACVVVVGCAVASAALMA